MIKMDANIPVTINISNFIFAFDSYITEIDSVDFFYHLGILSKMDFYCAFYFKLVSKLFMLTEMLFCSPMFLFHT